MIVGQIVFVSALASDGDASASAIFRTNGTQATAENGSETNIGNWVNPAFSGDEWEIRATLVSGVTPSVGAFNTWQDLSVNRVWTLSRSSAGVSECTLTFDFRRKGASDPETTIAGNVLYAEKLDRTYSKP